MQEKAFYQSGAIDTIIFRNNICKYYSAAALGLVHVRLGSEFAYNVCDSMCQMNDIGTLSLWSTSTDTAYHVNVYNNTFRNNRVAIRVEAYLDSIHNYASIDYNNFWDVQVVIDSEYPELFDSIGNIFYDPMFYGNDDYHYRHSRH